MIKSVTFDGHYFYDSSHNSDLGKFYAVQGLTLEKVLVILKSKGIDVTSMKNVKLSISVYYY